MKILQLCYKPPCPAVDGGCMGMNNVTQGLLAAGHDVHVLTIESDKHPVLLHQLPEGYRRRTHFRSVYVDLRIHPLDAGVALLCGDSYNVKRYESQAFTATLTEILQRYTFDIVQMESIYLTPYLAAVRQHSDACVVLHAPNVEHQIWHSAAKLCKMPLKRWYLKHLALALGAYEREMCRRYDGLVCVTRQDAAFFRQQGCKHVIVKPFGIDMNGLPSAHDIDASPSPVTDKEALKFYHIGSMDWDANVESIWWFLKEVWPQVRATVPQACLYLAGRKMPSQLMEARIGGVTMVGEVPDANAFIADKQVNVVPLLFGSGIRVKIIESMAMGKAIVATHVGAEGIDYSDGENILIADSAADFVRQIQRLAGDGTLLKRLSENARRLAETRHNNRVLTQQLIDFYDALLKQKTLLPYNKY